MSQKINFAELLKRHGFDVVDDLALETIKLNSFPGSSGSLLRGYYTFIDGLSEPNIHFHGNFYLVARAIAYISIGDKYYGHIDTFNISTLISSLSIHNFNNGVKKKASCLYTDGSGWLTDIELKAAKQEYLNTHVMGKTIEILKAEKSNEVEWKYVSNEDDHPYRNNYIGSKELEKFYKLNKDLTI